MLEALVKHYENLVDEGKAPRQGWSSTKVSFALRLDTAGQIIQVVDLRCEEVRGKKKTLVPMEKLVPEQSKRASGIVPQFLCDNSGYLLGVDSKGKPERSEKCFHAAAQLHQRILAGSSSDIAKAITLFFSHWDPGKTMTCSALQDELEEILKGGNLVFMLGNKLAMDDEEIKLAWEKYRDTQDDVKKMQCLVTGEFRSVARLHPSIKGVRNAQSSGASLISFNAPAYESYGRNEGQGLNAPVSEYATFAYSTALNSLLADHRHVKVFGDTTVVYWAEHDSEKYQDCFESFAFQDENVMEDRDLDYIFSSLKQDNPLDYHGLSIDYDNQFYILGLSPNAARLSVRFFLQASFGNILKNVMRHVEDMQIICPAYRKKKHIPLWLMLMATVSPKSKDKAASPLLAGATLKSILSGSNYPESLFRYVMLRIRAEQDDTESNPPHYKITYERCAIIKAYLCRNIKEGAVKVALDESENDVAYVLGRIFSVWEHIQSEANQGINVTIKDRYFDSACATPARIFPILQKLAGHHLRKLEEGNKIRFEKKLTNLMGKLNAGDIPVNLSLKKQGMFILGYYHQTQERYTKKGEKKND